MSGGEPPSFSVLAPARRAREILAPALEILQREAGVAEPIAKAISHAARASNSLYRVEAEARTPEAAAAFVHAASESLALALKALSPTGRTHSEHEMAAVAIARALALLYPITQATQRKRRPAFAARALSDTERDILEHRSSTPAPLRAAAAPVIQERRSVARIRCELDIGLYSAARFHSVVSLDLSSAGVFLKMQDPLPPGNALILHFLLPGGHAVEADAEVCWARPAGASEPAGMGVRFVKLSAEDQSELRKVSDLRSRRG
jgi:uncharacterized protein (TIGR02266 family)